MNEIDTPYKRAVHMILHGIINLEDKYVLDKQFVRWGKVERDLWELEHLVTEQADTVNRANRCECIVGSQKCGFYHGDGMCGQ